MLKSCKYQHLNGGGVLNFFKVLMRQMLANLFIPSCVIYLFTVGYLALLLCLLQNTLVRPSK